MNKLLNISIIILLVTCPSCKNTGTNDLRPFSLLFQNRIEMSLERLDTSNYAPFRVTLTAINGLSIKVSGLEVQISTSRGTASSVTDNGDGTYSWTVTPDGTNKSGEYVITGTIPSWNKTIVRTALMLKTLHTSLGQPLAVPGIYVNTAGWEDSINITPNGEWLLLMYSPMSISGVFLGDPNHEWAKQAISPWKAPERPGFPDGRIDASGTISHIFPLWCDYLEDTVVQPITMYSFHRQYDGTFAEPVMIGSIDTTFNNPMLEIGPHAIMTGSTTARMAYSFADPLLGTGRLMIYTADITVGNHSILGEYYKTTTCPDTTFSKRNVMYNLVPLDNTDTLHLFDPHLTTDGNGAIRSIWVWKEKTVSDELSRNIFVYSLKDGKVFPGDSEMDWERIELPSPINNDNSVEMQPHFTGSYLYFYRNGTIVRSKYTGGPYGNSGSWEPVEVIIDSGTEIENILGQINVVGEPTLCVYEGKVYLYFVYAIVVDYDNLLPVGKKQKFNLNAGFVELK